MSDEEYVIEIDTRNIEDLVHAVRDLFNDSRERKELSIRNIEVKIYDLRGKHFSPSERARIMQELERLQLHGIIILDRSPRHNNGYVVKQGSKFKEIDKWK